MANNDFISNLYIKQQPKDVLVFDNIRGPGILNYFTVYDVQALNKIATSIKYAANIKLKKDMINNIMVSRGFKKLASGTNRVVYKCLENPSIVAKIAIDRVGMGDNPAEYRNQELLKPFVAKCFDVSPDGVLAICERVYPITTITEFESIADYVYDIIVYKLLGKYVVDDIGTDFFLNWGIREGAYPCLLDYPYVFELDDKKLYCNKLDSNTNIPCLGEIDYDEGFNYLTCKKCGKKYKAFELSAAQKEKVPSVIMKGDRSMKVYARLSDGRILSPTQSSDFIEKPMKTTKKSKRPDISEIGSLVYISKDNEEPTNESNTKEESPKQNTKPKNGQSKSKTKNQPNTAKEEVKENKADVVVNSNFIPPEEEKVSEPVNPIDDTDPDSEEMMMEEMVKNEKNKSNLPEKEDGDDPEEYKNNAKKKENPRRANQNKNIDKF